LSDGTLVEQFANGSPSAFEELLARYHCRIYSYILMMVHSVDATNNIMQDTFLKVMRSLQCGHYKDKGNFSEWLMRIAYNNIVTYNLHRSEEQELLAPLFEELPVTGCAFSDLNAEERMVVLERRRELRSLLKYLSAEQREVVLLRYYKEYSFKEIASALNISINTALGRARYAQINLRKMMTDAEARAKMMHKKWAEK
jgi:RNA polymerase sigma-70 factor (ECF subfamily)